MKEKATQWKNWGNELHKEREYELMADYYTLALEFTPTSKNVLMATLLSNRCLALVNLDKFKEALADAEKCIKIRPQWFRVSNELFLLSSVKQIRRVARLFLSPCTEGANVLVDLRAPPPSPLQKTHQSQSGEKTSLVSTVPCASSRAAQFLRFSVPRIT